ncbi:hypothetical protein [Marinobacter sp. ATCH36]|uniref:hypothetical protein n=1 Tax=Marinobacter sp. ATCH36 TaxID=2945106 RepID=UPI002021384C|nr:hypothetical protein [Marinobacter sp. ATCH36]MCL7945140.1 hypothetical protein [Marinobacter sp. ATCH36]
MQAEIIRFQAENLLLNYDQEILRAGRSLGIRPNSDLAERFLLFLMLLTDKDQYSVLKVCDTPEFRDFFLGQLRYFRFKELLEKEGVSNWTIPKNFLLAVKLSNLYGLGNEFFVDYSNEIFSVKGGENFDYRGLYATSKLADQRPQFLFFNENKKKEFTRWVNFFSTRLELLAEKALSEPSDKKKSERDSVLFLLGHAQPLKNVGSHWRQAISYAYGYALEFPETDVYLVVTNECATKDFEFNLHALPKDWRVILMGQVSSVIGQTLPGNMKINLKDPFQDNYLSDICETLLCIRPSITFFWLGFFQSEIPLKGLAKISKLFAIEFQAGNEPSKYSKYIFSQGKFENRGNDQGEFFYIEHPIPLIPESKSLVRNKTDVCIGNRKVFVTTLGNGRIESALQRYNDRFLTKFRDFVIKNNIIWVFIGVKDKSKCLNSEVLNDLYDKGYLHFYQFVDDLRSFYEHCEAYVHLPLLNGGGWGIALAAIEKVPCLVSLGTDADNFLPDEALYNPEDEDIFWSKVEALFKDDQFRNILVEKQVSCINNHSPRNVAKRLYFSVSQL